MLSSLSVTSGAISHRYKYSQLAGSIWMDGALRRLTASSWRPRCGPSRQLGWHVLTVSQLGSSFRPPDIFFSFGVVYGGVMIMMMSIWLDYHQKFPETEHFTVFSLLSITYSQVRPAAADYWCFNPYPISSSGLKFTLFYTAAACYYHNYNCFYYCYYY